MPQGTVKLRADDIQITSLLQASLKNRAEKIKSFGFYTDFPAFHSGAALRRSDPEDA